jgi:hypothetical protein
MRAARLRAEGTRGEGHGRRVAPTVRRELWQGKKTVSGTSPCTSQSQRTGTHKKKDGLAAEGGLHLYGDSLSVV